ncbi:MAG: hypothetical protein MI674_07370 [Cytophagales bacterium]|nr:hypothetical protein [Cytophagales bacterium]
MSFRIKNLLIVLITFLAAIGACGRRAPSVSGGQPSNTGQPTVKTIIKLLSEGKSDELKKLISEPLGSPGDTLSELRGAVGACMPNNTDREKLLSEVVFHCAEKGKDIPLSVILANAEAQAKLTPDDITASFDAAVAAGHDEVVKVILAQALDKIPATALQGAFSKAAAADATAPLVAAILGNKEARKKVGDTAIAEALQRAVEEGLGEVEKAIRDHWSAQSAFIEAIDNGNADRVKTLLSHAKTKDKIDKQTVQNGLQEAANEPAKTDVVKAILENLGEEEIAEAFQKAADEGKDKVVAAILANADPKPEEKVVVEVFQKAADEGKDKVVAAILANADPKPKAEVVVEVFQKAADEGKDKVVAAILTYADPKPKEEVIVEALKKAANEGEDKEAVIKAILDHWDVGKALINAVENGNSQLVEDITKNPRALNSLDPKTISEAFRAAVEKNDQGLAQTIADNAKDKLSQEGVIAIFEDKVKDNEAGKVSLILRIESVKDKIGTSKISEEFKEAVEGGKTNIVGAIVKNAQAELTDQDIATVLAKSVNRPISKAVVDNLVPVNGESIVGRALSTNNIEMLACLMNNVYLAMEVSLDELSKLAPKIIKDVFTKAAQQGWYNNTVVFILKDKDDKYKDKDDATLKELDRETLKSGLNAAVEAGKKLSEGPDAAALKGRNTELLKNILDSPYVQSVLQKEDIEEAINIAQGDTEIVDLLTGYQST